MGPDPAVTSPKENIYAQIWEKYHIAIIVGSVSLLLIAISITLILKSVQTVTPIEFLSEEERSSSPSAQRAQMITVDVEGGVVEPGVYRLESGARISDAITKAGGFAANADRDIVAKTINLASKLVDGAKLYIPKKGDPSGSNIVRHEASSILSSQTFGNLVNINSASQAELEALPGIGPVTAAKIISNRPYQTLQELVSKKAISQSLFTKLNDSLGL